MEDLNVTYANLLQDGSELYGATLSRRDGRYIVGMGYNAATGRVEAFLLNSGTAHNGDVNHDGCVNDADLAAILSAFGRAGHYLGRVDVNCDGVVDDADLQTVLSNYGSGC